MRRRSGPPHAVSGSIDLARGSTTISLRGASVHRGATLALNDVSFDIPAGSLTAVVGPNGAGKSSLFGLLSGRLQPSTGEAHVDGDVAEVLQSTAVDEDLPLSVEDVVRIGRYPTVGLLRPFRDADRRLVDAAIESVDLTDLRKRPIHDLSGGQRQRALVAQGLAQDSSIMLLDEPSSGLDAMSQRLVQTVMRRATDQGTTVLFATHDLNEAALADNVIVLACECICCAPPVDAFADPAVTALFGPVRLDEVSTTAPFASASTATTKA